LSKEKYILDDVLRNAASRSDIPDMSASWDGIASGLDALQRRRKRRLIVFFSALFLTSITSVLWFTNSQRDVISEDIQDPTTEITQTPTTPPVDVESEQPVVIDSEFENVGEEANANPDQKSENRNSIGYPAVASADAETPSGTNTTDPDVIEQDQSTDQPEIDSEQDVTIDEDVAEESVEEGSSDIAEVENDPIDVIQPDADTDSETEEEEIVEADREKVKEAELETPAKSATEDPKAKNESGWEINIAASPGLAAKLIAESANFGWLVNQAYSDISNSESSSFSYQVDLGVNRKFNDRFYMGLGLRYVEREERVQYDYTIDKLVTIRESEKTLQYTDLAPVLWRDVNYDGLNRYQFIDIPVRFGILTPLNDKVSWRNEFSVNYSRLIAVSGKKVDNTFLELIDANSLKLNKDNFGVTAKTGIMWSASPRLDWTLDGLYNMNMSSLRAKEQGLLERPFNYGVTIGANYKILTK